MKMAGQVHYFKKLKKKLAMASDEDFIKLVWAVDALQSDRVDIASRFITYPTVAATEKIDTELAIYKWELEVLINLKLLLPSNKRRLGRSMRELDCRKFEACATVARILRRLEESEAGAFLEGDKLYAELRRVYQRQFPWQRGYFNKPHLFRFYYIYNNAESDSYFSSQYGLSINEFSLICYSFFCQFQKERSIDRGFSLSSIGVSDEKRDLTLKLICREIALAKNDVISLKKKSEVVHGAPSPIAYRQSILRQYPFIAIPDMSGQIYAPLPALVIDRMTSGLYYDLIKGGREKLNPANFRFEKYVNDYVAAMLPTFDLQPKFNYGDKKSPIESPDLVAHENGEVALVGECKAARPTFAAQFSEDPLVEAEKACEQLAQGIFQLWRYLAHIRLGIVAGAKLGDGVHLMLVTLYSWFGWSVGLEDKIVSMAHLKADKCGGIIDDDRRKVILCTIDDLEIVLMKGDRESFDKTLRSAQEERFRGWTLYGIFRDISDKNQRERTYPFSIGDVLPWYSKLEGVERGTKTVDLT